MILFLDATALAVRYLGGPESKPLRRLLKTERTEGIAISSVSLTSFTILLRDLKSEGVTSEIVTKAAAAFQVDLVDLVQLEVDPCLPMASRFTLRYGLGLEPAIQLASACRLEERLEYNAPSLSAPLVKVVTFDPALARATRELGLAAWTGSPPRTK